ncbi:MAG: hypothetical protein HRT66_09295, partial [Flavobacteriaceae bacterium]|nr:hypothetical protein [Flavobacteriaceae bacterium]
VEGADILLICTEWSIFRTPDFKRLRESLNEAVIFDGRNLFELDAVEKAGFKYTSIGRSEINKSKTTSMNGSYIKQ